jgi:subtilase family serine protease
LALALPAFAQPATQLLGPEDQSKQINVTYWLKQHNKAAFDELVRQQYDPASPNYHHWLTPSQYQARFAPTAADMAVVNKHLAENNLTVVRTDKFNHAVTARGTVGDIQRATGVQINRMLINGEERRVGSGSLAISGPAGKLVYEVQGLTEIRYKNFARRPIDPDTGKPFPSYPLAKSDVTANKTVQYFDPYCLRGTQKIHLTTPGDSGGPYETYTGARYGANITWGPPNLPPCGYDSTQMQTAYGMKPLFGKGLLGQNQTIVIVDAYGDDTIASDANAFSSINSLPALTADNFGIFYPTGPTNCGNNTCGWDVETALDVEWSHTMAPKANIALVLAADNSDSNLDLADLFAAENQIGSVISNSFGSPESELISLDPAELIVENNIAETAAALGVSLNASSGDDGDHQPGAKGITVGMPAAAPYVTGVGGTSLFLNPNHSMKFQTGWGTNLARIASYSSGCGQPTCDPVLLDPEFLGFYAGAGGGTSAYWAKPSYQASLSGSFRMVPDIAYLADPYTGVEFVDTEGGTQFISVVGGTSLASPMFAGMWAVVTQAAGTWLGQAAPLLYTLPAGAITDVVAVSGPNNVTGMTDSPPLAPQTFTAAQLAAPLENSVDQVDFMSLLYQGTSTRWYVISFGVDTSLNAGPGWDNVTGLGTPNGAAFVNAIVGKK